MTLSVCSSYTAAGLIPFQSTMLMAPHCQWQNQRKLGQRVVVGAWEGSRQAELPKDVAGSRPELKDGGKLLTLKPESVLVLSARLRGPSFGCDAFGFKPAGSQPSPE